MGYRAEKKKAADAPVRDVRDHPVGLLTRVLSVGILTVLHGMTFADRYCVAGALGQLVKYYDINNTEAGLISTLFLVASIIGSPVAGYVGDRYNRKRLLTVGCLMWIGIMTASSFIPHNMFWLFLLLRCLDGFSENIVYACAPSLIADYFSGQARSYAFMFFYYAINVGAAFGVMVGASIADSAPWQWSLRFVPCITAAAWLGVVFVLEEPPRGASEEKKPVKNESSYWEDIKYLAHIKTFLFQCLGMAAVNITAGSQGWWNADIVLSSIDYHKNVSAASLDHIFHHESYKLIMIIGGFVGIVSSISGVSFVVYWAESWKQGKGIFARIKTMRAPALVIAISLSIAAPATCLQQPFVLWSVYGYYACQFISTFFTGSAWVLSIDVLYAVTSANRRATSILVLTLVQHLLGDGPGPYIAGSIADAFRGSDKTAESEMWSLLKAFFIINACTIPAFLMFYMVAISMKADYYRNQAELTAAAEAQEPSRSGSTISADPTDGKLRNDSLTSNGYENNIASHANGSAGQNGKRIHYEDVPLDD